MQRERLSLWGKAILGCLTLWALVVILPDFSRVFDQDFNNKLPFEADNNGELTKPESDSPLADCQSIDLRRNYCEGRMSDLLAVFGGMGGMQYVWRDLKVVSLYVRCTSLPPPPAAATPVAQPYAPLPFLCGQPVEPAAPSQLRTVATKVEQLDFLARVTLLLAQMSALLFIALACWLVLSRPSAATWGFFLYAIWFNPGQYYVFYAWLQHWSSNLLLGQEVAQAVFQAIGYCGFILFALRFPRNEIMPQWRWLERGLPLIGGVVLVVQLYAFLPVFGFHAEWAAKATFIVGVLVDALVLTVLFIRYRRQGYADRHRLRYVFWCSIFGLGAFILAEIDVATTLLSVRFPDAVIYLLYSLNASVAVAVWHAVRKYRVVDVKFTLSRHLTYAALWALLAVPLILLTHAAEAYSETTVERYLERSDVFINILITLLLILVAVALKYFVDFVHERAIKVIDSIFFRKLREAEKSLDKFIDKLAQAEEETSLQQIEHDLVAVPMAALELSSAALFRLHDDGYRRMYARGWPDSASAALDPEHAIIRQLKSSKQASLRFDPSALPAGLPSGAAAPALAIAIKCAGRIEAVVFYGAHREGDDLNDDELAMLNRLAAAASSAYTTLAVIELRHQSGSPGGQAPSSPAGQLGK